MMLGWGGKDFWLGGKVRTPGAVRSGAIPPPKTNPLHATVHPQKVTSSGS